jgi:hypothetical protein
MQEQKAARQLSTPSPLAPHHTTTPPTRFPRGGSRTPCRPRSPGRVAHLRTSSVSRQNFHAWHPGLPCTSAPNQRTESSNPCLPRGLPPRTRTEWEDSYKPTNQNSKNCKPGIRPLWEWGPARLKEGKLERPLDLWILMPGGSPCEHLRLVELGCRLFRSHEAAVCIAFHLAQTIGDGRRRPYCTVQR